jgi:Rrf2 family cysteine metabolism transcriptional repressor
MQLSTRGRYGLRAAVDLAQNFEKGPVPLHTIAERQGLSVKYLHSLLAILKRWGLVQSLRGAGGGYVLTRPPSQVSVSEVVRALEGSLGLVGCVEDTSFCDRAERCPVRSVWVNLNKTVENALSELTLEDIIDRASESKAAAAMYHI